MHGTTRICSEAVFRWGAIGWAAIFGLLVILGQGWATASGLGAGLNRKGNTMPGSQKGEVVLLIRPRPAEGLPLLPEQSAEFEVILRNDSVAAQSVLSLSGNQGTPSIRMLDNKGQVLGIYNADGRYERKLGKPRGPRPADLEELAPRQDTQIEWNLWGFRDPLPPSEFDVEVQHRLDASGNRLTSNRLHFDILPAQIGSLALGYESSGRLVSFLAWIAKPATPKGPPRLLVRMSVASRPQLVQAGATPHFEVSEDARVAVGQIPPDGVVSWLSWVAVVSNQNAEMLRLNNTYPKWRSPKLALPIRDAVPVPRFPDRGHAVPLATGTLEDGRPALAGAVVKEGDAAAAPWRVPLSALPRFSACTFGNSGPIALLFVSTEGGTNVVRRLDVDESGAVVSAEREVRRTPHEVLAAVADLRPGAPPAFLLLEANPQQHDRIAIIRVPLNGPPEDAELKPLNGWPMVADPPESQGGSAQRPLRATEVTLEVAMDGTPWLAFINESGAFYGGPLNGTALTKLREADGQSRSTRPQIAALGRATTFSCFTEQGRLFHAGNR